MKNEYNIVVNAIRNSKGQMVGIFEANFDGETGYGIDQAVFEEEKCWAYSADELESVYCKGLSTEVWGKRVVLKGYCEVPAGYPISKITNDNELYYQIRSEIAGYSRLFAISDFLATEEE